MNEKEIREIRRRFRPNKSNIMSIKGCIVDREKNIKSIINQSMINTISDDCEKLFSIIKKTLSGGIGTNLIDIEYSAAEVMESNEHKLLMELRNCCLKNDELLMELYSKIIESVHFEDSFAILAASDTYDVFDYNENGEREEDSSSVFSYMVCCVCPIKNSKQNLYFSDFDNSFRCDDIHALLGNPEVGFMFPTFDDRASNIYKAQLYTKNIADVHSEFIKNVFNTQIPMASTEQKDNFSGCMSETLSDECSFNVIRTMHEQIYDMVQEHKAAKEEEPLRLSKSTFTNVLEDCGISENKVSEFENKFEEQFGKNAELNPVNVIDVKKFEVTTPYVTIKVAPDRSDLISTEIINGSRYILIRANDNVEINGVNIDIK